MSELMLCAAIFVQHRHLDAAKAVISRIKELAKGKEVLAYEPAIFNSNLDKLLRSINR